MRAFQIGSSLFTYPLQPGLAIEYLPSLIWGTSQPINIKLHNKWDEGSNILVHMSSSDPNISFTFPNGLDHYVFTGFAAESDDWTTNIHIFDSSSRARLNVPISIKISGTNFPDRDYTIYINITQNPNVISATIPLLQNETITSDIAVNNIDGVGDDELLVGTSAGRLIYYRNGVWAAATPTLANGIYISPSIGDINCDGEKEIVIIDIAGNIKVLNTAFTELRSYQSLIIEIAIGSLILEDVTNDNVLDIVYGTNEGSNSNVRVIDYYRNVRHSFFKDKNLVSALAVGDANHNSGYEIIASYYHIVTHYGITRNFLGFSVLNFNSNSQLIERSMLLYTNL